ncbi:hypothetical protein FIBSPDRAFT_927164 [Athelia psychrophila]|uniref:AAA+ ATPase domain-containing protein n=1 Tax=Athelia psychrophila TaxID=1759441 RepID=A0A166S6H1_9AGAM|nr:hypothetical protein FIBSPDRAFT_927164 [Fibularhizoctonia sp. CBS 109695]
MTQIPARTAKHQLSDMPSRIAKCQKRCSDLTEILRGRVQLDTNMRVKGIQDAQKEDKIETWMGAPDTSPNYNAAREKHQPDTGSWFLDGSTFATWKKNPNVLLWLQGGPGCGKTILCAAAIQHIIDFCDSKLSTGYAYFLFDGRSAEAALLVHEKMIRSIIMQLARRCDGIPAALVDMYNRCERGLRQPSIKLLQDCLSRILEAFDRVYIIIDSLDECAERKEAARIVHDYAGPSIRGKASIAARTAKHQLSDMPSRIAKCQKRCSDLTEILRGRVQLDTNTRVKGIQDAQKERDIDIWMAAPDTSPNFNAARKKHQPETCSWFLDGSTFATWKEHPDFLLWLHGGPGCGKTVLCAAAIQHIIDFCDSKLSTGYAYFFFDGRNAEAALLVHEKMIRSIIMQLARRCDGIPTALVYMYDRCDRGLRQPSIKLLQDCLSRILEAFERVYIIMDSLDECSERNEVVHLIQSMVSGESGKLHMMATSRLEPEIMRGIGSLSNLQEIGISAQLMEADVRLFLNARLDKSDAAKWTKAQKDMMKEVLIGGADGMFRWVALQIDRLMKCRSELELVTQLKSLPRDLNETYCRILSESPDPVALKRFLQWLAFSKIMMTVEEIAEVAVIDFGENDSGPGLPVYDIRRRYQHPRDVLGVCYGLVTEVEGMVIHR